MRVGVASFVAAWLLASSASNAICVFGIGSCNELTREAAAKILKEVEIFPRKHVDIKWESLVSPYRYGNEEIEATIKKFTTYINASETDAVKMAAIIPGDRRGEADFYRRLGQLRVFMKFGLLKDVPTRRIDPGPYGAFFEFVPTFEKFVNDQCNTLNGPPCQATTAQYWSDEVTGMTGFDLERMVEYKVVRKPTPLGEKLGVQAGQETRNAKFVRYDDGWRWMK